MATVSDRALRGGAAVPGQRGGAPMGSDDDGAPKASGKKKLIGIVVAALALVLAAGGGWFMLAGPSAAEETEVEAEVKPKPGVVVPLEPITINLADGRYLQIGVALQQKYPDPADGYGDPVDGSQALDIVIDHLSGMPMTELAGADQRAAVKADLVSDISEAYDDKVYDIYFTSFVMQ